MIDLSIIIPHYNSANTIKKLLDSIPKRKNIQILVIDDNSDQDTDELKLIINDNNYEHITFIKNYTDKKGAGVCRNIGLHNALGNWVLFADSDDFFVIDFYTKVSKYFNSKYDVVFFTPTSLDLCTNKESERHLHYERLITNFINRRDKESELYLRYKFGVPWSKLIRRSILSQHGLYFDEVLASNDVLFSTKLGYYFKEVKVSKEIIYCVTKGIDTLTTIKSVDVLNSRLNVHIDYTNFLRENLDKKEFEMLNINGKALIYKAIKSKYGFRKVFSMYLELRKHKIKVF